VIDVQKGVAPQAPIRLARPAVPFVISGGWNPRGVCLQRAVPNVKTLHLY